MPTRLRRRKAARARRRKKVLAGALAVALAAGGGSYLARSHLLDGHLLGHYLSAFGATPAASAAASSYSAAIPCPPGSSTGATRTTGSSVPASPPAAGQVPLIACPQTAASSPVKLAPPSPAAGGGRRGARGGRKGKPAPSGGRRPSPSPSASVPAVSTAVRQVLALINKARAQAGLAQYTLSIGLAQSAAAHTALMAAGCGLSHQCPGEPGLGARETAAGVQWTAAGENIGEGGPEPNTQAAIARMAVTLTQDMLNEQPPSDGHRRNILSTSFRHIGIALVRDSSGTVWMTQDFSS